MNKPTLFVGSSVEGIEIARAIESNLQHDADVEVWDRGVFTLSTSTLEALENALPRYDFAVLVLSADDLLKYRGTEHAVPRDNLLFELGLFMGRKGRQRVFFVMEKGADTEVKLPTDLLGITPATFSRSQLGWKSALSPACNAIRDELKKHVACNTEDPSTPRLAERLPSSLTFDRLMSEYEVTIDRLERDEAGLRTQISEQGDFTRLTDGLYAGLLCVSRSVITGFVDPTVYGNLMELQRPGDVLRVRYSGGPYNEEIITRRFPLTGAGRGVASEALRTGKIQIRNDMADELKLPGESRLQSMMSVPLERLADCSNGSIAVLNVDCAVRGAFPIEGSDHYGIVVARVERTVVALRRVGRLNPA